MTELLVAGNLALSRALGDFVFKKNEKKRPEEQIVTGRTVVCCLFFCSPWNLLLTYQVSKGGHTESSFKTDAALHWG